MKTYPPIDVEIGDGVNDVFLKVRLTIVAPDVPRQVPQRGNMLDS